MMRNTRFLVGLACAVTAAASLWTGCTGKKQTEIVVGVETQMRVPADMQSVRLIVNAGGPVVFDQVYAVYDGVVRLPETLALVPGAQQSSITITVLGYKLAPSDPYFDTEPPPGDPQTQILRRSVVQYAPSRIVYLAMPLRYACQGVTCSDSQTCVAGQCVDANVDSGTLPDYADEEVFGNTSTCFSVSSCFIAEEPAVVLDPVNCLFALPGAVAAGDAGPLPLPPAQTNGVNVRIQYENLETEVLDQDPLEGFSIPDMTQPQTFTLPKGLCDQYIAASDPTKMAPHRIVSVGVTGLCPAKAKYQPLCDGDTQNNNLLADAAPGPAFASLARATTALYMLVDDSSDLGNYFGQTAFEQVLAVTLSDPIFQSVDVAFSFFPRATSCAPFPAPDVAFATSFVAKPEIAAALASQMPSSAQLGTDLALQSAYASVKAFAAAHPEVGAQAVVLITGNDPETKNCVAADNTLAGDGTVATYVVAVQGSSSPPTMTGVQPLISAGGGGQFFDATSGAKAAAAFSGIADDLTSCVYLPSPAMDPNGVLSYVDPLTLQSVAIPPLAPGGSCATSSGWIRSGAFVKLCSDACSGIRTALTERTTLAALEGVAPPDLPIFAQLLPQD
jgi:hypothetical protein